MTPASQVLNREAYNGSYVWGQWPQLIDLFTSESPPKCTPEFTCLLSIFGSGNGDYVTLCYEPIQDNLPRQKGTY